MNYQRITISLPNYLYEDLMTIATKGMVSNFITEAVEKKILQTKTSQKDAFTNFWTLRKIAPKKTIKQILAGIHKGRE